MPEISLSCLELLESLQPQGERVPPGRGLCKGQGPSQHQRCRFQRKIRGRMNKRLKCCFFFFFFAVAENFCFLKEQHDNYCCII